MLDLLQQIDTDYYRTVRLLIVRAELEQLRQVGRFWSPTSTPRDSFLNQPRPRCATTGAAHSIVSDQFADK
jgi:hypothetical protein